MLGLLVASVATAKTGRVLVSDEALAAARDKVARLDWAAGQRDAVVSACAWVLQLSDQELWDYVPPAEQRRALNVSFGVGCPVHGTAVFRKGGHYPWLMSGDKPFKVTCPVGGESYPSNDFRPWNPGDDPPEKGNQYVDHGTGWVDAQGHRYWFVAHYLFWHRWQREILPAVRNLGTAWLLTDDPRYAHKAAVLMARLASDYAAYDYHTQAYHNGQYPNRYNGRIIDHIWMTGVVSNAAWTYDAVFPVLAGDRELVDFLAGKGILDVRATLEQKLLGAMATDILTGVIRGNMGMHQQALARVAAVLGNDDPAYAPTTAQMRDWLLHGEGDIEQLLWNGFYRDGHGGESSPGYSSGWCANFYEVAELLPLIGVDIWSNPKVKKMADIGLDLTVAGQFTPDIGDSGSIRGSQRVGWAVPVLRRALEHYRDPRHAKALKVLKAPEESLWEPSVAEASAAALAGDQTPLTWRSRVVGGYGLAVLEAGPSTDRRGLSIYYGHAGGGHGHRDRLTLELWAFGRPMLPDMGYPAHWLAKNGLWTSNTISHYAVVVDGAGQKTTFPGSLVSLVDSAPVQFAEAEADQVAYPGTVTRYRRASALIDLDDGSGYLVDLFRVVGGRQHDWSFHGPPFPEFSTAGLSLSAPAKGTLAGEEVPFGGEVGLTAEGGLAVPCGHFDGVLDDARPYADRSLEAWARYSGGYALTRKVGAEMTTRLKQAPAGEIRLQPVVHDYKVGRNVIEVVVAGQTLTFAWGAGDTSGWIELPPQSVKLPGGPVELKVIAREIGQSYALIDRFTLATGDAAPAVLDLSTSGFQYLYDVRRARPDGGWSATWSLPDDDLHLTVHVPDGCAGEAIVALAEPELQPGAPDKLEYLLGRNVAGGGAPLESTYAAVVEPYRGAARIRSVKRLELRRGPAQAIAVAVEREGATDLLYSSPEPEAEAVVVGPDGAELTVAGRFVRAVLRGGRIVAATLIDGGRVDGAAGELAGPVPLTGSLTAVDVRANTVTLDQAVDRPESLVGRVLVMGAGRRPTSYQIVTARNVDGHTVLGFGDVLLLVGQGQTTGYDAAGKVVACDMTRFVGYGRVDGGQHQGRWLLNESQAFGPRIDAVRNTGFQAVFAADPDGFLADLDADGRRTFWIADVGPGERYTLPAGTTTP